MNKNNKNGLAVDDDKFKEFRTIFRSDTRDREEKKQVNGEG